MVTLGSACGQRQPLTGDIVVRGGNRLQRRPTLRLPTRQKLAIGADRGQSRLDHQMPALADQRLITRNQRHGKHRVIGKDDSRSPMEWSQHGERVITEAGTVVSPDRFPVLRHQSRGDHECQCNDRNACQTRQAGRQWCDPISMPRIRPSGPKQQIIPRKITHRKRGAEGEGQQRHPIAQLAWTKLQIKAHRDAEAEPSQRKPLPRQRRSQSVQTSTHTGRPADSSAHQRSDHHQKQEQKPTSRKHEEMTDLQAHARLEHGPETVIEASGHAR